MWLTTGLAYLLARAPWFWIALGAVLGAVAGSSLNCARYRLPRGLSLRRPAHSFCPACKARLQAVDLVPILSWLWLKGRCRRCGVAIGVTSLVLELALAGAGALLVCWAVR
jgi:leader peptidase (prepilin peptidase)/N-methyltransferase